MDNRLVKEELKMPSRNVGKKKNKKKVEIVKSKRKRNRITWWRWTRIRSLGTVHCVKVIHPNKIRNH